MLLGALKLIAILLYVIRSREPCIILAVKKAEFIEATSKKVIQEYHIVLTLWALLLLISRLNKLYSLK